MTKRFGEDTAQHILSRAVELDDRRKSGLSHDQLHEVAHELGLSSEAITLAIAESTERPPQPSTVTGRGWWLPTIMASGLGLGLGAVVRLFPRGDRGDVPALLALGAAALTAMLLIARYRNRKTGWLLQATLLGLWGGLAAGFVLGGRKILDPIQVCALCWAVSAVAAIVVALVNQLYDPKDIGQ